MIATASAFALHFAHHTFASGFSQALVGVKLVHGELDHTKFFLPHKTSFVLTTDKASGQSTVRNYFLSLHSEVVRLQVTAHCCVTFSEQSRAYKSLHKLLREPSQLKVRLSQLLSKTKHVPCEKQIRENSATSLRCKKQTKQRGKTTVRSRNSLKHLHLT